MNIQAFQQDLNDGMSIEECCNKHHVTLEYAFKVILKWQIDKNKRKRRKK